MDKTILKRYDLAVIGAGASGMAASISAARQGRKVILIEKKEKPGRKILLTGNGRCNLTNVNSVEDKRQPVHYHGRNPKFVISVLNKYGFDEVVSFFNELGIEFKEEDEGRYFPSSNQASSIIDVLVDEIESLNIKFEDNNRVKELKFIEEENRFYIKLSSGKELLADKCVIATGGLSFPTTGSSGDGYEFAKNFGHTIIDTFPAYTAVATKSRLCQLLQGVKMEVGAKVFVSNDKVKGAEGEPIFIEKAIAEDQGTLMFAHFGLSAPVILRLSRVIAEQQQLYGKKAKIEINFLPQIPLDQMEKFLIDRWEKRPQKTLGFSFVGLLPNKVFPAILEVNGIDPKTKVAEVSKEMRKKIIQLLTRYEFIIDEVRGYDEAHFTAGGVDTKEVNPSTLESKIQHGLYFCGEVLDIDGDCGGYNLQWAFSSGLTAGESAA